eukprot:NODE_1812_length_1397_cov_33.321958_g1640_i0.p1 GENE.NODE_1812_length_1397_cov_33.321958_g1640_i0~~NODE_1812_length_1397_cov_33.321958_g1640_i0.p1  ORF type:complete len:242 (+),score=38.69 NODE_1812_length_1397_cov_33.321958_g1640_i0:53-727(+)
MKLLFLFFILMLTATSMVAQTLFFISSLQGCPLSKDDTTYTMGCAFAGGYNLTMTGSFGLVSDDPSRASVTVGDAECTDVSILSNTTATCKVPPGSGLGVIVRMADSTTGLRTPFCYYGPVLFCNSFFTPRLYYAAGGVGLKKEAFGLLIDFKVPGTYGGFVSPGDTPRTTVFTQALDTLQWRVQGLTGILDCGGVISSPTSFYVGRCGTTWGTTHAGHDLIWD